MSLNSTSSEQYMSVLERTIFGFMASLPCLVCLWVNSMMLWTLRSTAVFLETPRFVMLFHLLLADTMHMVLSQLLFLMSFVRIFLYFPLCLLLVLTTHTVHDIPSLILVLMSAERFVAVCLPLRHAAVATPQNTVWVCVGAWVFNLANALVRLGLTLQIPASDQPSLNTQMMNLCNSWVLYLGPHSRLFDEILVYSLFLAAFLSIGGSYTAVMRVARSASTDQASAHKARTTLLLHLVQLCLIMISTFHDVLMMMLLSVMPRLILARFQTVFYILLIILPKCLSALVYGLRDRTIRAALLLHLRCKAYK